MVYFVASKQVYDGVYPHFLDDPREDPFRDVGYEADPATLDLNVVERERLEKGSSAIGNGFRVDGSAAPKKMLYACGDNALPDMIPAGPKLVSPRLRSLMEQFEPNVHQFFPVDIYKAKEGDPVATYFWLNICNRIDSVDPERSSLFWKPNYAGERGIWREIDGKERKVVFSRANIGGHHFWYDPFLKQGVFCSNAFAEKALISVLPGLSLTPREGV